MPPRLISRIWLGSLLASLLIGGFLAVLGGSSQLSSALKDRLWGKSPSFETVFLGSSLLGAAVPPEVVPEEPRAFGTSVRRWVPLITSSELVREIELVLLGGPETVFLDARPLTRPKDNGRFALRMNSLSRAARLGAKSMLAWEAQPDWKTAESEWLQGNFELNPDPDLVRDEQLRAPDSEALSTVLEKAEEQGVRIILLDFPRPSSLFQDRSDTSPLIVHRAIEQLSVELGLDLFAPGTAWPDALFADHTHLNAAGRARYMRELSHWWAAQ